MFGHVMKKDSSKGGESSHRRELAPVIVKVRHILRIYLTEMAPALKSIKAVPESVQIIFLRLP